MTNNDYKATIQYAGDEFFIATSPSGHAQTVDGKGDRKCRAVTARNAFDVGRGLHGG